MFFVQKTANVGIVRTMRAMKIGKKYTVLPSTLQEWRKKPTAGLYADGQMSLPSA
jgi:hypothetical protein